VSPNGAYFQRLDLDPSALPTLVDNDDFQFRGGVGANIGERTGGPNGTVYTPAVNGFGDPVTFRHVHSRRYNVEYSCKQGYDIQSRSFDLTTRLNKAYETDAGTKINMYNNNLSIPVTDEVILISDPEIASDQLELTWARDHASQSWRDDVNQKRTNTCLLYGLNNLIEKDRAGNITHFFDDAVGISGTGALPSYSFILVNRIENIFIPGTTRQKEFTRVIIHELGHQRGLSGSMYHGGHPMGHKGTNTLSCVMNNPGEYSWYGTTEITQTRENPVFCEGHQQKLLNTWRSKEDRW
ncbi:MAG: hypothetical protein ABI623_04165, partial [bacterium]